MEYDLARDVLSAQQTSAASLRNCVSGAEVVALCREYIEAQDEDDWARLPAACQRHEVRDVDDIASYALCLMKSEFQLNGRGAVFYYEVADFFVAASRRLAEIASPNITTHPFFSRDAYLEAAGAPEVEESSVRTMDDLNEYGYLWVYRYRYWDEQSKSQRESQRYARLEVIKCGLGEAILASGKKIPTSALIDGAFSE